MCRNAHTSTKCSKKEGQICASMHDVCCGQAGGCVWSVDCLTCMHQGSDVPIIVLILNNTTYYYQQSHLTPPLTIEYISHTMHIFKSINMIDLISLTLMLSAISSTPIPFSSNIPTPTELPIDLSLQAIHGRTTVPITLPIPTNISTLLEVKVHPLANINCTTINLQPTIVNSSVFALPQSHSYSDLEWDVEIMSIARSADSTLMYVLLDNGTLIQLLPMENYAVNKVYQYTLSAQQHTPWLQTSHQLHHANQRLYALVDGVVAMVTLQENGKWKLGKSVTKKAVLKAVVHLDSMFLLTVDSLYFLNVQTTVLLLHGTKFVDLHLWGYQEYWLLDGEVGLRKGTLHNMQAIQKGVYLIQGLQYAVSCMVVARTAWVTYRLDGRNFVGEFYHSGDNFVLNRYYHNYQQVRRIIPHGDYAIIDGWEEFFLMRHSVNRNSASTMAGAEFIYESPASKIAQILQVDGPGVQPALQLLVAHKNRIENITILPASTALPSSTTPLKVSNTSLSSMTVQCSSDKPGRLPVTIQWKGVCSQRGTSSWDYYCRVHSTYILKITALSEERQEENMLERAFILLGLGIVGLFLGLVVCGCGTRMRKLRDEYRIKYEGLLQRKEQVSQNMECTFNVELKE